MLVIEKLKKEYVWMAKNGIDLSGYKVDNFLKQTPILKRSFKNNPNAVKNLFNYKFKFKRDIDSGILALYERIQSSKNYSIKQHT